MLSEKCWWQNGSNFLEFGKVRSRLFSDSLLPTMKEAFAAVTREERWKKLLTRSRFLHTSENTALMAHAAPEKKGVDRGVIIAARPNMPGKYAGSSMVNWATWSRKKNPQSRGNSATYEKLGELILTCLECLLEHLQKLISNHEKAQKAPLGSGSSPNCHLQILMYPP